MLEKQMTAQEVSINLCTYNPITGADGSKPSTNSSVRERSKSKKRNQKPPKANKSRLNFIRESVNEAETFLNEESGDLDQYDSQVTSNCQ